MISIIILNYNGLRWNTKCISTLLSQTYEDFEIIFVDNNSTDTSLIELEKAFSDTRIHIIKSSENLGFAGGNNLGISHARGEYILLLNNDTWVEEDFLEKYIKSFEQVRVDILGVTERRYSGDYDKKPYIPRIDFFGHTIYMPSTDMSGEVTQDLFYTSGVCVLCTKEFYKKSGGLDADFFMYFEEIDWIWRTRLFGYKIGQLKNLSVYHATSGSTGSGIKYKVFLWRNQNTLQMLLKNYSFYNLLWVLPIYIVINIAEIFAFALFGKFKISFSYLEGWWFNIKYLKRTLRKRKEIQENRILSDREIMKHMYLGFGKFAHLIRYFR